MVYVMDLPYVRSVLCAGVMRTEPEVDVELCGVFWVSSCGVCQGVKKVNVAGTLFHHIQHKFSDYLSLTYHILHLYQFIAGLHP